MKIAAVLALSFVGLVTISHGQPAGFLVHDGMTVSMDILTYTNALIADQKFLKASPEKRAEAVTSRNSGILAGKAAPSKFTMVYKISKEPDSSQGATEYKATTNLGGKEYSSYMKAVKDTLYLMRSKGVTSLDANGESAGYILQGIEKIPFNLKVGDVLPVFEDIGGMYPKASVKTVQDYVKTGSSDLGTFYEIWDVSVRKSISVTSHTLNYVKAVVTRTEPMAFNGKQYTASVIESQTWSKGQANTTLEVARDYINKKSLTAELIRKDKAMLEKQVKNAIKSGMLNEDGYVVLTKEEWFVPELGVMKIRNFDMYGSIVNDVVVTPGI